MASFTGKITLRFALLVTGTTAGVLAVGGYLFGRLAVNGLDYLNHAEFVEVRDRLSPDPALLSPSEIEKRMSDHAQIDASLYFFQVFNSQGNLLFRSPNMGHSTLPVLQGDATDATEELVGIGAVRVGSYEFGNLRILIASPLEPVRRLSGDFLKVSVILLTGVAIASVGLGWQFARLTLRPVRRIRETATRIRADNLSERIPVPPGKDELTALACLLNQMFDRLEQSFDQVQRFTADASHELKTPLALVRLNAEKLSTRLASDPESSALCGEVLEGINELSRVIEILLFLAKAEGGLLALQPIEIEAKSFILNFADDATALAEDAERQFIVLSADSGTVTCEPTLIRQLLLNLTTNALRVSPPGGTVRLESTLTDDHWQISVIDDGPGVPSDQIERIFERFVRYSPTAGKGGQGLGLAICRSIAGLHEGTVRAENRRDSASGLQVIVNLPRKKIKATTE